MSIAFVASGGGAGQAFGAGVINKLIKLQIQPDHFYGVSAGALLAAQYAFDGSAGVMSEWSNIKGPNDFIKKNYLRALWSDGHYQTDPLKRKLNHILADHKRPEFCDATVGYTDLANGSMVYVSSSEPRAWFREATLASASIPIVMNSVDGTKVDGGVLDVTPLGRAVDEGHDEVYVILASPMNPAPSKWKPSWPYQVSMASRAVDLMLDEIWRNDLKICELYNKADIPGKRKIMLHVYEQNPRTIDTLDFTNEEILNAIKAGENAKCIYCGL